MTVIVPPSTAPVRTLEPAIMVPILVLLLLQVPSITASLSVTDEPEQVENADDNTAVGVASTVKVLVAGAPQPVE